MPDNPKTPPVAESVVEQVARAICESKGLTPNTLYQHNFEGDWPEDDRREYNDPFTGEPRVMLFHRAWRRWDKAARAAIAAMPRPIEDDTPTDAGEGVEPVAWMYERDYPFPARYYHEERVTAYLSEAGEYAWTETRLYAHPTPTDTSLVGELVEALEWYGEQARLARLIHREGDAGRHALAEDGGKLARTALSKAKDTPHG